MDWKNLSVCWDWSIAKSYCALRFHIKLNLTNGQNVMCLCHQTISYLFVTICGASASSFWHLLFRHCFSVLHIARIFAGFRESFPTWFKTWNYSTKRTIIISSSYTDCAPHVVLQIVEHFGGDVISNKYKIVDATTLKTWYLSSEFVYYIGNKYTKFAKVDWQKTNEFILTYKTQKLIGSFGINNQSGGF